MLFFFLCFILFFKLNILLFFINYHIVLWYLGLVTIIFLKRNIIIFPLSLYICIFWASTFILSTSTIINFSLIDILYITFLIFDFRWILLHNLNFTISF